MVFVINWEWRKGVKCYVTKNSPNRKPYTSNPLDKDCKTWKTRKNAERFLSRKDKGWASSCVIEEICEEVK